jgi:hypothetical protein
MFEQLKEFLRWWRRAKSPVTITAGTKRRIELLFQPSDRGRVVELLERECSTNLPLLENCEAHELERIQFAALKLSDGDLGKLIEAIRLAQRDWRDLLFAAGFEGIGTHAKWIPTGANKTDAGNGSKAICRVSNVLRSPSPDPSRSVKK